MQSKILVSSPCHAPHPIITSHPPLRSGAHKLCYSSLAMFCTLNTAAAAAALLFLLGLVHCKNQLHYKRKYPDNLDYFENCVEGMECSGGKTVKRR